MQPGIQLKSKLIYIHPWTSSSPRSLLHGIHWSAKGDRPCLCVHPFMTTTGTPFHEQRCPDRRFALQEKQDLKMDMLRHFMSNCLTSFPLTDFSTSRFHDSRLWFISWVSAPHFASRSIFFSSKLLSCLPLSDFLSRIFCPSAIVRHESSCGICSIKSRNNEWKEWFYFPANDALSLLLVEQMNRRPLTRMPFPVCSCENHIWRRACFSHWLPALAMWEEHTHGKSAVAKADSCSHCNPLLPLIAHDVAYFVGSPLLRL